MKIVVLAGAACILAIAAGGCSSVIEGRHQSIMINTNPTGAECGLYRQNIRIATVQNTPSSALIEKSKHDIWVVCIKQGYQQATHYNKSGVAGATFGNIILGGGIGWAIDSASGADNKYESPVNIALIPNAPGQVETSTTLPPTFAMAAPAQAPASPVASGESQQAAASSVGPPPVVAPTPAAESASPSPLDGPWLIEMQLSTTYGTTVGGECPPRHSLPMTFAGQIAEGPWGRLRLTRNGDLGGWMSVPGVGTSMLPFIVSPSGRMDNAVVTGTISGRCTGSFVMTRQ